MDFEKNFFDIYGIPTSELVNKRVRFVGTIDYVDGEVSISGQVHGWVSNYKDEFVIPSLKVYPPLVDTGHTTFTGRDGKSYTYRNSDYYMVKFDNVEYRLYLSY